MQYENIVFMQSDSNEFFANLDRDGELAALEYLKQWHYPGEHEVTDRPGHGSRDYVFRHEGYIMSWNRGLGYCGLEFEIEEEE